jgi:hypothetical protein
LFHHGRSSAKVLDQKVYASHESSFKLDIFAWLRAFFAARMDPAERERGGSTGQMSAGCQNALSGYSIRGDIDQ